MDDGVVGDVVGPLVQLRLGREFAVEDQVGDFEIRALLRQFLDRIAAIAQDSLVAVDEVMRLRQDAVFMNAGS